MSQFIYKKLRSLIGLKLWPDMKNISSGYFVIAFTSMLVYGVCSKHYISNIVT